MDDQLLCGLSRPEDGHGQNDGVAATASHGSSSSASTIREAGRRSFVTCRLDLVET